MKFHVHQGLIEEILHQPVCTNLVKKWDSYLYHFNWCMFFSTNTINPSEMTIMSR